MKFRGVDIEFVLKPGPDATVAPMGTDELVTAQEPFRQRIAAVLKRAAERAEETFEMSGQDNRYPHFPVIGASKIAAQETYRILKEGTCPLKKIIINLQGNKILSLYRDTFEGYIRHLERDLGEEPYYTVDLIIELPQGIVLIERSNPPFGWAFPGGFIDPGEEPKQAAVREAKEETNLDLEDVTEFKTYGQPGRDPRFQTESTVFIARGIGTPLFGDDAKGLKVIPYSELLNFKYAFDHKKIMADYLQLKRRPSV
ncbi:MAG: NUDIX domain-containing protein [Candidatus Omnitrophota bacterium]